MNRKKVSPEQTMHAKVGKMVEHFQTDLAAARSHSLGRDRRVGQVMCYLSLMRSAGLVASSSLVTCTKAILQHYASSRAEGRQAAHFLPGQLKINGRNPWNFLQDRRTAEGLKGLFGDVEDLPADFNKADSAAEAYRSVTGLKEAFAYSCRRVIQDPKPLQGRKINRALVRNAFTDWTNRSRAAYQKALGQKSTKVNVPPLKVGRAGGMHYRELDPDNIQARQEAMHRDRHYLSQTDFLKQYLATAGHENLTEYLMDEIERTFRP